MMPSLLAILCLVLSGCHVHVSEEPIKEPPVKLSVEFPNAAGGGIPNHTWIHVRNESKKTLRVLPDISQACAAGWFKVAVYDARGEVLKQVCPFIVGPPHAPQDADYLALKPATSGLLEFPPGLIVKAYDLKPGQLYFFHLRLKFDGLEAPAELVMPFGYEKKTLR